eukprot:TRINITY_DN9619_c1_g1_i1.p1 TRINITY_DN9619_c1_g1~~TRINITY_DN9619_c1_g1_i1.p1  ORF type:complete len:558 (-),score=230.82 TRINITY_DN9619_c1_g1_i1:221-1894(-)
MMNECKSHCLSLMSPWLNDDCGSLCEHLAMTSVMMVACVKNTPLVSDKPGSASMAAGVPHFSVGYMRNWGRDTFISLRGLLLTTGRYEEAKNIILGYARSLRHGLIPNLMNGGTSARFNARDATWWFLQAIQDYCKIVPQGTEILKESILRFFPSDHQTTKLPATYCTLAEVIQEIVTKHANGISFTEWNAGPRLDEHMKPEGFHVKITMDDETGFLLGGNEHNCGTWMDKMGSCHAAGIDGIPGTPRDGAPVEITGLLYSTLRWLDDISDTFPHISGSTAAVEAEQKKSVSKKTNTKKTPVKETFQTRMERKRSKEDIVTMITDQDRYFPFGGVSLKGGEYLTYKEWADRIEESFEKKYYKDSFLSEDEKNDKNKTPFYRDCVGSHAFWHDDQLRCNQVVAMAVAPGLFNKEHAKIALKTIKNHLVGEPNQIGMKTLSPHDWAFRGDYDNAADASDPKTANGWNYHQGPEWVWPIGYFMRALRKFDFCDQTPEQARITLQTLLSNHRRFIESSWEGGLPELTNKNGFHCKDSCTAQAWSTATLLDAFFDVVEGQEL